MQMETSINNLAQQNQEVVGDLMVEEDEEIAICPTPSALHFLDLPDSVIFQILTYLPFSSVGAIAQVCSRFRRISSDELLWRHVFLQHYKLPSSTVMPAKARSWREEFKRLYYHTPAVLSEERKEHKDEVLHVSFSHDGTMFATCSKDGFFKVWECTHPVRLLFKMDMKSTFSWKFTQFSQFNESDTCLLVSGVYFGRLSTSGEIAVFNLQDDFRMQCRVTNKPYDVFGAWYDNDHLLSGTLYWTGDFNSVSAVWLSKASQEVESEVESVSMVLYRFENVNSSSIRLLHVAEVDRDIDTSESILDKEELEVSESAQTSPNSSSIGSVDEAKISMDIDTTTHESEVKDKSQGQERVPVHESCMHDLLLQNYLAKDKFHLGEVKSENLRDDVHFQSETSKICEKMDYINTLEELSESNEIQMTPRMSESLNEVSFDFNKVSDLEQIDSGHRNSTRKYLLPMQKQMQAEESSSFLEGANSSETWPSFRQEMSDMNIEQNLSQVNDNHSQVLKNCDYSPDLRSPKDQHKPPQTSTEAHEFNISKYAANLGSKTSSRTSSNSLFSANSVSTGADCLSHPLSTFPLDDQLVWSSTTTDSSVTTKSQEFEPLFSESSSSIPQPLRLPAPDDRFDVKIRTTNSSGNRDKTRCKIDDILNISGDDCVSEGAVEVGTEYMDMRDNNFGDASESFHFTDESILSSTTSDGTFEGASTSSCVSECSEQAQNNLQLRDKFDISYYSRGASDNTSAASLSNASVMESKPGARDVSQQVDPGFGSRNASVLNVPSLFDNNLVMLIPGASHVYGSRNFGSAAQNMNNSNANSHNISSSINGISGTESDVDMLVRETGTSHSHKSSIATQTEIASSRASSFHSLSHISQSSSISRDFRCSPPREKLLIYTWGSETYIPHKVGIKRMKWTDFTKGEVTARRSSMLLPDVMENLHNMAGNRRDKPDVTIEMHGHIVGLSLSPDHKYLYVNCRPWPKNYIISDPQESPPLAQEVEVSTIDLTTFNFVGPVLRSHKAYTHSDECFFLNLDVSDDYVASGAEDRQGYLWDRHYGIPLYRFPHRNVVNCVAINPQDSEILVTVSDDYTFKVWMSRCRASELTGSREASTGTNV